jgi:hypothetical protein
MLVLSRAAASWGYTLVPRFVIRSSTCDLNCSFAFCTCPRGHADLVLGLLLLGLAAGSEPETEREREG